MAFVILFLLIGIPVGELWVMIEIGAEIGAPLTILLIIATAVIGTVLFRVQGLATLRRVQTQIARDEMPVGDLVSGFGLLLAGFLLLVPGFVTDAVGFLLFVPPVRAALAGWVLSRLRAGGGATVFVNLRAGRGPGAAHSRQPGDGVIDGDYEDLTDRDNKASGSSNPQLADRDDNASPRQSS